MESVLFKTQIECSLTMMGKDVAELEVFENRLTIKRLNTQLDIPNEIYFNNIKSIKFGMLKYVDFKITIEFTKDQETKTFQFVTCNDMPTMYGGGWSAVSNPIKTFKCSRIIKKLMTSGDPP